MSHKSLPVLFVSELVVLPGMVVSIELDESSQAAIDAARASSDGRLLVAPRLEDRYASYGVIASVERVGRLSGGTPAAVLKAERRGRIGAGVSGPGAALWVEVEAIDDHVTDRAGADSPRSTSGSSSPCCSGATPGRSSTRSTR